MREIVFFDPLILIMALGVVRARDGPGIIVADKVRSIPPVPKEMTPGIGGMWRRESRRLRWRLRGCGRTWRGRRSCCAVAGCGDLLQRAAVIR